MLTLDEIKIRFANELEPWGFSLHWYESLTEPKHQYVTISYPLGDKDKYEEYNEWGYVVKYSNNGVDSQCKFAKDNFPSLKEVIRSIVGEAAYLRDLERNHRCY